MKKIIFLFFILFIFNSCSNELITVVDEYNPLYQVRAIPGNASIKINFWSGILASDFAGFNLYISTTQTFTNALLNSSGGYPTIPFSTHARSNITLTFPTTGGLTYNNGTLYYVSVTAYGTNDLAEGGKIETRIDSIIPVVPRQQQNGTPTGFTITPNSTVAYTGGVIKSYGVQSNFDAITVFTNNNITTTSESYAVGGLYIASNTTTLYKLWITSSGSTYATHTQADKCNTI
ncbi:hypothetical protein EPJ69_11210 [Brachyspira aalborgi]|uniref:SbsA Ig-like domain-containing protein n=1 Tax=Brachyspira aalborgi TaxID=29522 RepID=A0A5C8DWL7_9SPIR|nr:hypothetical protein [Brachyspira aalborgi]TXJ30129.1 hypothetical protein EPJ69_11210 [Brachyspira aalborgi]